MTRSPKTPLGAPPLVPAQEAFARFCQTVAALRDPQTGCPWDLKQDHKTLRRFVIEEAYEAAHAMADGKDSDICDELGDVLLQVVLNAQVAHDRKAFTIVDVINAIDSKMIRRHPHVFDTEQQKTQISVADVRSNWDKIKAEEKGPPSKVGYFDEVKGKIPALTQALEIGKKAAKIEFDWPSPGEVLQQVLSEVEELKAECLAGEPDHKKIYEELGDVFFSLAQLARHYVFDPETVALDANRKFLARFSSLESIAKSEGKDITSVGRDDLEALWQKAKAVEKRQNGKSEA